MTMGILLVFILAKKEKIWTMTMTLTSLSMRRLLRKPLYMQF